MEYLNQEMNAVGRTTTAQISSLDSVDGAMQIFSPSSKSKMAAETSLETIKKLCSRGMVTTTFTNTINKNTHISKK